MGLTTILGIINTSIIFTDRVEIMDTAIQQVQTGQRSLTLNKPELLAGSQVPALSYCNG